MNQSTAFNAGHLVGVSIAYIVIYGGILALGIYFGRRLARKRGDGTAVRWPVGVAVAVIALLALGQCSAAIQAKPVPVANGQADVVVEQRVSGPAAGFPTDFNADFIREYDIGIHEVVADAIRKRDASIPVTALVVSTTVVTMGRHKILKSKAQLSPRIFMYQFTGAVGENLMMVVCTSRTGKPFDTAGTPCERTAAQVFGA